MSVFSSFQYLLSAVVKCPNGLVNVNFGVESVGNGGGFRDC